MPQKPTIGRIVLYVLPPGHRNAGQIRPAIVVQNWNPEMLHPPLNLHVFHDPANDESVHPSHTCSVQYSDAPIQRTWHWPPRLEAPELSGLRTPVCHHGADDFSQSLESGLDQ